MTILSGSNTSLDKYNTYINLTTHTHTLPTPNAENEIITIYSTVSFTLQHHSSGNIQGINANTKTLCISQLPSSGVGTGPVVYEWTCITFEYSSGTSATLSP